MEIFPLWGDRLRENEGCKLGGLTVYSNMFEVNITGVFMTAQAVAKQMIKFGNGGSIVMIASMSGTVANRVSLPTSLMY